MEMAAPPKYRLGVDVGGTFTDLLLLEEATGTTWRAKVPSTPDDQSIAVNHGIDQIISKVPQGSDIELHVVNHGTTIATNAILEQKGRSFSRSPLNKSIAHPNTRRKGGIGRD